MEANNENKKMQLLISSTLRIGVITACTIALVSGIYYLISYGMDPMPDYQSFHGETTSLTTLSGIFTGIYLRNLLILIHSASQISVQ